MEHQNHIAPILSIVIYLAIITSLSAAAQPTNLSLYDKPLNVPLSSRKEHKTGALEAKITPYEKYFRQTEKIPASTPPVAENKQEHKILQTKVLNKINRNNYTMLFSIYEQNVEIMRFFQEFLKANPDISLEELRIKTQQLKFNLASYIEILSLIRSSIERNQLTLKETEQKVAQLSVQYMNRPHYSDFANAKQNLDFESRVFNFFLLEITDMNTAALLRMHQRVIEIIEKITTSEKINWSRSNRNLLLSQELDLVQMLRQNNNTSRTEFLNLRNYFRYTELEIVNAQDKIQSIKAPVARELSQAEAWDLDNTLTAINDNLIIFGEQELINQNIMRTRLEKMIETPLNPQELLIGPLSRHLFFNQSIDYLETKTTESTTELEDNTSNALTLDIPLPDWI